jgi:2-keto-4-pentenoate hydratase/2-oxohepta-3-ene-1,7-dioic acid hydratase in catechol pathway
VPLDDCHERADQGEIVEAELRQLRTGRAGSLIAVVRHLFHSGMSLLRFHPLFKLARAMHASICQEQMTVPVPWFAVIGPQRWTRRARLKLISFLQDDRPGFGVLSPDGSSVANLSGRWPSLKAAIAAADVSEIQEAADNAPVVAVSAVELSIPVPDAERFVCAGLNFRAHALEGGHQDAPANPSLFLRSASTFVAHGQPIVRPTWSDTYDYECEFAVVVKRGGRHIRVEDAMDHVFGYTLLMDGTVREVQFDHSLVAGKNFYRSGAIGPWIVTADEVPDPTSLQLTGRVNGDQRQTAPISDLIFDIPTLIAYWSRVDALSPGDIISVGTPAGVGFAMDPKTFLQVGDVVETEVSSIGVLRNTVVLDN